MPTLVLLRHGESQWNSRDLFTGWVDVDLTARGEQEARHSGQRLREARVLPGTLHTSMLGRTRFAPNGHSPWPLQRAELISLKDELVDAAGLPGVTSRPPDSVLYSAGVHTRFGLPLQP